MHTARAQSNFTNQNFRLMQMHNVSGEQVNPTAYDAWKVRSEKRGDEGKEYRVFCWWDEKEQTVKASCSCTYARFTTCKHALWAVRQIVNYPFRLAWLKARAAESKEGSAA